MVLQSKSSLLFPVPFFTLNYCSKYFLGGVSYALPVDQVASHALPVDQVASNALPV